MICRAQQAILCVDRLGSDVLNEDEMVNANDPFDPFMKIDAWQYCTVF